jgi:hypothetical protein
MRFLLFMLPRSGLKPLRLSACALLALWAACSFRASAADITAEWIGVGYAKWTDPANWKDGIVPVNSSTDKYNVIIANTNTTDYVQCSLTSNMEVSQLTLGNVLYIYPGGGIPIEFHVRDNFHWLGGVLSGYQTQYHLHGESLFDGLTSKRMDCTLTLHDHARWTQGNLEWAGYGMVQINAGALFEILTGGSVGAVATTDSADVYNQGTMRMNAPGQSAKFFGIVHNSGAIEVEAGNLQCMWKYDGVGSLTIQAGARMVIWGPSQWRPFAQAGGGELFFADREQEVVSNTTFSGFTRIGADFFGDGDLTLSNAVWQGGQLSGPGALIVPAGGQVTIQGTGPFLSRRLLNTGDLSLAVGASLHGDPARLFHTNFPSGTIHLASATTAGSVDYPVGTLVNQGNLLKDDGAVGSASFYATVQNQGLIQSRAGRLNLALGGTNWGQWEAQSPGQIVAQWFSFEDSSALLGDGQISLSGGTLRGSVSTNLNLVLSSVTVLNSNLYSLKTLQVGGWVNFPSTGGAEVRDFLTLNGGLYGGLLRSRQEAELSFPAAATVKSGARLELLGDSALLQGSLTFQDTNTTLLNAGTLHGRGASDLLFNPGASFLNQGAWRVSAQMGAFKALLTDKLCRLSTANAAADPIFGDGPFQISGPVQAQAQGVTAGPGAQLCFSDFALTNASVTLLQSALTVTTNFSSSNATVVLDQGTLIGPATPWKGSVLFTGQGTVQGSLALQALQLAAGSNGCNLVLNGSLALTETNALLQTLVALAPTGPVFPHLQVVGPVTLNARFDLVAGFAASPSNLVAGPITLLESDQPISGSFLNATNGATLATATNSYRFQLFYGPNSPFGANKVVLTAFGTAFDNWRMRRFSAEQLQDPLVSGPTADPDRNGWNNLSEFVLAIDPTATNTVLPTLRPGPEGYATLHLRKRKDLGGLQATLAVSPDLRSWQQTTLGASPSWMELHRVFDLGDCYDYTYLYRGSPSALFLKLIVGGQY